MKDHLVGRERRTKIKDDKSNMTNGVSQVLFFFTWERNSVASLATGSFEHIDDPAIFRDSCGGDNSIKNVG